MDQGWGVDKQRDVVVRHRQVLLACTAGRVISHKDEDRLVEPGFSSGLLQELADRVIGVLHRAFTTLAGRDVDAPIGIGIRPVVGGGHQLQEEGLALGMIRVGDLEGLLVKILIGHAPGVLEGHIAFRHAALVDNAVAIAAEEGIHVVEVAAPAVDKHAVITKGFELLTQAAITGFTANALDD